MECRINIFGKDGIYDSYRNGQIRDHIKKVCAQTSQLKQCFITEMTRLRPCFSAEERPYLDNYLDGESQLHDYLCYNDGERVIRFLEEGGLSCIHKQEKSLTTCFKVMQKLPWRVSDVANVTSDDNMFQSPLMKETCTEILETRSCVVDALRRCERREHADFVDSLTDVVLRNTPCKDQMPAKFLGAYAVLVIIMGVALLVLLAVGVYRWRRMRAGVGGGEDVRRSAAGAGPGELGLLS